MDRQSSINIEYKRDDSLNRFLTSLKSDAFSDIRSQSNSTLLLNMPIAESSMDSTSCDILDSISSNIFSASNDNLMQPSQSSVTRGGSSSRLPSSSSFSKIFSQSNSSLRLPEMSDSVTRILNRIDSFSDSFSNDYLNQPPILRVNEPVNEPPTTEFEEHEILKDDIIGGRGGLASNHDGNKRFQGIIKEIKSKYRNTNRESLLNCIIEYVRANGLRFVTKDGAKPGHYRLMDKEEWRTEISQALQLSVNEPVSRPVKDQPPTTEFKENELQQWDIIGGRGGRANNRDGNKRFREAIQEMKSVYRNSKTRTDKIAISKGIIDYVHRYGARFVTKDGAKPGHYRLMTEEECKRKTSQALRETKILKWTRQNLA